MDPMRYPGIKVPSAGGQATSTFTIKIVRSTTTTDVGIAGFGFNPEGLTKVSEGVSGKIGVAVGCGSINAGVLDWSVKPYPILQACHSAYRLWRPVSGVIVGEYLGSSADDQGTFTCGTTIRDIINTPEKTLANMPGTVDQVANFGNAMSFPVRNGIKVFWYPLDNSSLEFTDTTDNEDVSQVIPWIVASGLKEGVQIRYTAYFNCEGIPREDGEASNLYDVQPTVGNLQWLEQGMNVASKLYKAAAPLFDVQGPGRQMVNQLAGAYANNLIGRMGQSRPVRPPLPYY